MVCFVGGRWEVPRGFSRSARKLARVPRLLKKKISIDACSVTIDFKIRFWSGEWNSFTVTNIPLFIIVFVTYAVRTLQQCQWLHVGLSKPSIGESDVGAACFWRI